ncbi:MAG: DUF799 family lipoprotein [Magnetococcus sp. YQC-5]
MFDQRLRLAMLLIVLVSINPVPVRGEETPPAASQPAASQPTASQPATSQPTASEPDADDSLIMDPEFKKQPSSRPRLVAVLPFLNTTDDPEADTIVRRSIYNHFSSMNYLDMELTAIDKKLKQNKLDDPKAIHAATPAQLAKILPVDAVIRGKIIQYQKTFAVIASQVSVGAELQLVRLRDGKVLWQYKHTAQSTDGSIPLSPIGAIAAIVSSAMNVRQTILFRMADEMGREMVQTIPDLPDTEVSKPPKITLFAHNGVDGPKKAGDVLQVILQGDPQKTGTFDIGSFKKNLPLHEESPGIYKGSFRIGQGDNLARAELTAYLKDTNGNTATWIDFLAPVTFDSTPPAPPQKLKTQSRDKQIHVSWHSSPDADVVAYQVYRSNQPLAGYTLLGKVERTEYQDHNLINDKKYYYRVQALDQAGNVGSQSDKIDGIPMTPGPTPVTKDISIETTWRQAASPYVVTQSIIIQADAILNIEPGTEIILSPHVGMTVKGQLVANGTTTQPITWRTKEASNQEPWLGMLFDHTKSNNQLSYATITGAQYGVVVNHAQLTAKQTTVSHNGIGFYLLESGSTQIISSLITQNHQGGIIVAGGSPSITDSEITVNKGGAGLLLKDGRPKLKNNLFQANQEFDVVIVNSGKDTFVIDENRWNTIQPEAIYDRIAGPRKIVSVIDSDTKRKVTLSKPNYPLASKEKSESDMEPLLPVAIRHFKNAEYPQAFALISQVLPKLLHPAALYTAGRLFAYMGEDQKALKTLKKAAELGAKEAGYHHYLALHLFNMGKQAEAISEWETVLQLEPNHPLAMTMLTLIRRPVLSSN